MTRRWNHLDHAPNKPTRKGLVKQLHSDTSSRRRIHCVDIERPKMVARGQKSDEAVRKGIPLDQPVCAQTPRSAPNSLDARIPGSQPVTRAKAPRNTELPEAPSLCRERQSIAPEQGVDRLVECVGVLLSSPSSRFLRFLILEPVGAESGIRFAFSSGAGDRSAGSSSPLSSGQTRCGQKLAGSRIPLTYLGLGDKDVSLSWRRGLGADRRFERASLSGGNCHDTV